MEKHREVMSKLRMLSIRHQLKKYWNIYNACLIRRICSAKKSGIHPIILHSPEKLQTTRSKMQKYKRQKFANFCFVKNLAKYFKMNCQLKAIFAFGYLQDQRLESMFLVDHLKKSVSENSRRAYSCSNRCHIYMPLNNIHRIINSDSW